MKIIVKIEKFFDVLMSFELRCQRDILIAR